MVRNSYKDTDTSDASNLRIQSGYFSSGHKMQEGDLLGIVMTSWSYFANG